MITVEKMRRAYKIHKKLSERASYYENQRPQGRGGIAVCDDEYAKKWQGIEFRIHFLDCYLMGDSVNWFFARWLTNEEAKKRNGW